MSRATVTIDGNEAAAYTAYKTNEIFAIYPITPSSSMGSGRTSGRQGAGGTSGGRSRWWWSFRARRVRRVPCMGLFKRER